MLQFKRALKQSKSGVYIGVSLDPFVDGRRKVDGRRGVDEKSGKAEWRPMAERAVRSGSHRRIRPRRLGSVDLGNPPTRRPIYRRIGE